MAAAGCVAAIRRLVEVITQDKEMVSRLIVVVYPIVMHSMTPDGLDACEDGLDITAVALYYGEKVYPDLWKLFPQMLYLGTGNPDDVDGGDGYEYLGGIVTCI